MELLKKCPICNGIHLEDYMLAKDNLVTKNMFAIQKCLNCNFKFTNPRPDKSSISKYYISEDYVSHSGGEKESLFNRLYNYIRNVNIAYKLALISKFKNGDLSLFDYGCGVGAFLKSAREKGHTVSGFEPSLQARELAIQSGIELETLDQVLSKKNKCFDVITLWHVLEHIHDIDDTITKLKSLLKDDGVLVVAVPIVDAWDAKNYKDRWAALDVPRHLFHFTQSSIDKLFSKFGMKIASIHPLKFDAYYISLLSEKTPILKYLKAVIYGCYSNFKARKNSNYSSLIFFIQKNIE